MGREGYLVYKKLQAIKKKICSTTYNKSTSMHLLVLNKQYNQVHQ